MNIDSFVVCFDIFCFCSDMQIGYWKGHKLDKLISCPLVDIIFKKKRKRKDKNIREMKQKLNDSV